MNRNLKLAIMLTILVAIALFSYFWAITNAPSPIFEPRQVAIHNFDRIDWDRIWSYQGDIELYYTAKTVISTINATLLVFLLLIYADIYSKIKSEFTIGLIIFSMILLLYALSSNPLLQWLFNYRAFGLGPFAMLPDLFTTLALAVLLYLTMK